MFNDPKIIINSFGLLCDIVGILIIWKYGLPIDLALKGFSSLTQESDNILKEKYKKWSKVGLGLIIFGFALQLASNWLPNTGL